jgi:hypothetical protein
MKKHYRHENDCLNCGTILEGRFCHNCGQENLEMKESFGHMMRHAISDYFHFDDQFFATLKPLLFKPGKLTTEYNAGHRVAYLHPVKMYIFISVIYFLLLFQSNGEPVKVQDTSDKAEVKKELIEANKGIDSTLKSPYIPSLVKEGLQKQKNLNNATLIKMQHDTGKAEVSSKDSQLYSIPVTKYATYENYLTLQAKLPEAKRDGIFKRQFTKNMIYYRQKYGTVKQAKEALNENFSRMIPKMIFLILTLFALILYISFWRDKKFYVEHMIYSFHVHCFVFLVLSFMMLLQLIFPGLSNIIQWIFLLGTLYIIWYFYKSLRVVYHRNVFRTITKMLGIGMAYLLVFTACMVIALGIVILFRPLPSE